MYRQIFSSVTLLGLLFGINTTLMGQTPYNYASKRIIDHFSFRDSVLKYDQKNRFFNNRIAATHPLRANKAVFRTMCVVEGLRFEAEVDFSESVFASRFDFKNLSTLNKVNFSKVLFSASASFENAFFDKEVNFEGAKFNNPTVFDGATFKNGANFKNASLLGTLSFRNVGLVSFDGVIDFTQVSMPSKFCRIDVRGTDITKLKFDYTRFKLYFGEGTKRASPKEQEKVYQALLDQQKRYGFDDGYQELLKEYIQFLNKDGVDVPKKQPVDTRTHKTFWIFIGSVLFFSVLVYFIRNRRDKSRIESQVTNYIKKDTIPLADIESTVNKGLYLWTVYQLPKDVKDEPEEFWHKYEQLLEKIKS